MASNRPHSTLELGAIVPESYKVRRHPERLLHHAYRLIAGQWYGDHPNHTARLLEHLDYIAEGSPLKISLPPNSQIPELERALPFVISHPTRDAFQELPIEQGSPQTADRAHRMLLDDIQSGVEPLYLYAPRITSSIGRIGAKLALEFGQYSLLDRENTLGALALRHESDPEVITTTRINSSTSEFSLEVVGWEYLLSLQDARMLLPPSVFVNTMNFRKAA